MRVGIITFHASHNYGSMLQAYALQKTVESLGHECEIINFRTKRQRFVYRPFFINCSKIQTLCHFLFKTRLTCGELLKYIRYEQFMNNEMKLSPIEYQDYASLCKDTLPYDCYISGSDQIWNTSCCDWDEAYGLGFVSNGRKIAYAPSMGPIPEKEIDIDDEKLGNLLSMIRHYDSVTVREKGTAERIHQLMGVEYDTSLDPTLLLGCEQWLKLEHGKPIVDGDYALMYTPWANPELTNKALEISKKYGLKLVSTMFYDYGKNDSGIICKVSAGPKQFLNLVRNARLVIAASFHAVAFSIIFGRQLYAFGGMNDSRISSLLSLSGLECFASEPMGIMSEARLKQTYSEAKKKLLPAVNSSLSFLQESIN